MRWTTPIAAVLVAATLPRPANADTVLTVARDAALATPAAAIDAVMAIRRDPARAAEPVTVRLSGTFALAEPLPIPPGAGPLTVEAAPQAALTGGRLLPPWHPATLNGHACWAADVPPTAVFRELWVNGRRATRARFPADCTLPAVVAHSTGDLKSPGPPTFNYRPGDVPDDLTAAGDVEAVVANRWTISRLPLDAVDAAARALRFRRTAVFNLQDGDPYWLEGSPRFLARPGSWVLDHHTVYYLPRPGEMMSLSPAQFPGLSALVACRASDVTFRGVAFAYAEWLPPVAGYGQASLGVPSAVTLVSADRCRFDRCTFAHLGDYALELYRNCHHDVIDHCAFTDLGAGAVKLGASAILPDPSADNAVTDCRITGGGRLFADAVGVWVGQSSGNRISHNEIADFPYTAVSLGWTWGYGNSLNSGNVVEANHIHHIGGDGTFLSDMGGVYVLGGRAGTVVQGNLIHDVAARTYGGWGIYLDEGTSETVVAHNLVYRTTHGGFHQHYGKDNVVRDNVFALGREEQVVRTRVEPHESFAFRHNVVYWTAGPLTKADPAGVTFDDNLYGCVAPGRLAFGKLDWRGWQRAGRDAASTLADPGFVDAAHDDYRFAADGAARRLGFTPPPALADVGPR